MALAIKSFAEMINVKVKSFTTLWIFHTLFVCPVVMGVQQNEK